MIAIGDITIRPVLVAVVPLLLIVVFSLVVTRKASPMATAKAAVATKSFVLEIVLVLVVVVCTFFILWCCSCRWRSLLSATIGSGATICSKATPCPRARTGYSASNTSGAKIGSWNRRNSCIIG